MAARVGRTLRRTAFAWPVVPFVLVASSAFGQSMTTEDRLREPGWWPTKGSAPRSEYVGPQACAECHKRTSALPNNNMARAALKVEDTDVFRTQETLTFRAGRYAYEIATREGRSIYSVTDGTRSVSAQLVWAFGDGSVGQSFLFERDGRVHEARVSYFDSLRTLGFTPGRALEPRGLDEAMARPVESREAERCFACHTTASTVQGKLDLTQMILGVTCEACHGPGQKHVAAKKGGLPEPRDAILSPRLFDRAASVDFCGACHRTKWDVLLKGSTGILALRSQPFRLQSSRCWEKGDARITCVACHDPHQPLAHDPLAYDEKCLSCHVPKGAAVTAQRPGAACPVETQECVTCHMPRYDVPEMHAQFTDHLIRVVPPATGRSGGAGR